MSTTQPSDAPRQRVKKQKPVHDASEFNLDVMSGDDNIFRWFLLCYLFSKPIQSSVAIGAWTIFVKRKLDTPWAIRDAGHRALVHVLYEGKYTRYAESTANGLKTCMDQLIRDYEGSLTYMLDSSMDEDEFSKRLQKLFGVGPKMAEIFTRETQEYFAQRVE